MLPATVNAHGSTARNGVMESRKSQDGPASFAGRKTMKRESASLGFESARELEEGENG